MDWTTIQTVLLDMDGTLLDLNFDTHFWLEHVPRRYGEGRGLDFEAALDELMPRYQRMMGTMEWYCVDYWSRELELDIARLKEEVEHLIAIHPHVPDFLAAVCSAGKRVVLVTNAHHKSLALKMRHTRLDRSLDAVICAHDLGLPKEHPDFWHRLQEVERFDPAATLFVDDSLPVLRSAREYGIAHLRAVHRPDSRKPAKDVEEFEAIYSFRDIMPR